jgi:hypothetical protein
MDIQFCDICSESVPLHDLEVGNAKRFGGRVVCKNCDEAMTRHVAPAAQYSSQALANDAPPRTAGATGGAVWLAASCVGVMALLAYLSVQCVEDAESRVQSDFAGQLAGVERRLGLLDARLERLGDERAEAPAPDPRIDALADAIASLARRVDEGGDDVALLAAFAALDARLEGLALADTQRRAEGDRQLAALTLEVERTRGDLALLAQALLEELAAAKAEPEPAPVLPEPIGAPWLAFLGGLASSDDSERWNSVEELGASGDPAAAPHVVPVLTDPEMFVRMAAARVLGNLGNEVALEPLVRALDDPEPSVREAAYASLCKLSGEAFVFEPSAEPKVRAKQVDAWREWLAKRATNGN